MLFATHPAIFWHNIGFTSKVYLFKSYIKYCKEFRCMNTKDEYGKVLGIEIKLSTISKFVMIICF